MSCLLPFPLVASHLESADCKAVEFSLRKSVLVSQFSSFELMDLPTTLCEIMPQLPLLTDLNYVKAASP